MGISNKRFATIFGVKLMTVEQFADEFWMRALIETIDLDTDSKYVTRGIIQSILHDMKETHKDEQSN